MLIISIVYIYIDGCQPMTDALALYVLPLGQIKWKPELDSSPINIQVPH